MICHLDEVGNKSNDFEGDFHSFIDLLELLESQWEQ